MNQVMYVYACKYVCFHIDETGSDQHDLHNQQEYGLGGAATVSLKFHIRGKIISAIAANTIRGVEDFFSIRFSNNFHEYICNSSLPVLHPFKGSSKHLIVTMASASIHHVDEVCGLIPLLASIGMVLSSLQPWPEPHIKECFHRVESYLRSNFISCDKGSNTCTSSHFCIWTVVYISSMLFTQFSLKVGIFDWFCIYVLMHLHIHFRYVKISEAHPNTYMKTVMWTLKDQCT